MVVTPLMQRQQRALRMANGGKCSAIFPLELGAWWVPSESGDRGYVCEIVGSVLRCSCPDFNDARRKGMGIPIDEDGRRTCKHIELLKLYAAELHAAKERHTFFIAPSLVQADLCGNAENA